MEKMQLINIILAVVLVFIGFLKLQQKDRYRAIACFIVAAVSLIYALKPLLTS